MSGQKSNSKGAKALVMGHGKSKIKNSQGFRPGSRAMAKAKISKRVTCCNSGIAWSSSQSKYVVVLFPRGIKV
jgi:hypothetical protein